MTSRLTQTLRALLMRQRADSATLKLHVVSNRPSLCIAYCESGSRRSTSSLSSNSLQILPVSVALFLYPCLAFKCSKARFRLYDKDARGILMGHRLHFEPIVIGGAHLVTYRNPQKFLWRSLSHSDAHGLDYFQKG